MDSVRCSYFVCCPVFVDESLVQTYCKTEQPGDLLLATPKNVFAVSITQFVFNPKPLFGLRVVLTFLRRHPQDLTPWVRVSNFFRVNTVVQCRRTDMKNETPNLYFRSILYWTLKKFLYFYRDRIYCGVSVISFLRSFRYTWDSSRVVASI